MTWPTKELLSQSVSQSHARREALTLKFASPLALTKAQREEQKPN